MTTWMVVEDEPDLYDMVLAMYSTLGVEGISFVTGEEAIEWIEEIEDNSDGDVPELVLLDIRLPGDVNGAMVGERMRKSPFLKDIIIVLMTAYRLTAREEREVMRQSGANTILYKPLPKLNELRILLEGLVNKRQRS